MPVALLALPEWSAILLPAMVAIHGLAVVAANIPNCRIFGEVITRFSTERNEVWLTIDDGPDPADTPRILEILARHEARATFFCIGRRLELFPQTAARIVKEGHELANHTHSHPIWWFSCAFPSHAFTEITRCNRALAAVSETRPRWFRSPLGLANLCVHHAVRKQGMRILGWSARGFDGIQDDPDEIVERILKDVSPGAILLLHEGKRDSKGESISAVVLERLLVELKKRNYRCIVPSDPSSCQESG
jgi:peptidoglycan/xylan/chitin deacetylase (PgdA/CDA1 family)